MKKITKSFFIMLLTLCVTHITFAQNTASIKGYISGEDASPLAFATVSLFDAKDSSLLRTVVTKENGIYEFQNLPDGIYYTSYSNVGYRSAEGRSFVLINSMKYCCDSVVLFTEKKQLTAVIIEGKKSSFIEAKMDKMVLNVENSPASAGATVFDVLEKAPGIYADKNGNLSMQGKSGVQIMIDGRPTYMSSADVTNLLKNMQSSDVQTIELITNPSAKYDASGNAGIINIKTKKSKNYGTNGSFTTGAGYGNGPKANVGGSLNNRTKKMNVFGNYNYNYNKTGRTLAIDRIASQNGENTIFSQNGGQHEDNNNQSMKLGVDYNINKNNLIGFLYTGYDNKDNQNADNITLMSKEKGIIDSSLSADNHFDMRYKNSSYNLNYKSKLSEKGQELNIDADYSKYHSTVNSFFKNYYFDASMEQMKNPLLSKNNTNSIINIHSVKADYSNPVTASLKMEGGAKATWIHTDNDLVFSNQSGSDWQKDPSKSNHFKYDENVFAAYVNGSREWETISLQVGLRAEYSDTKGNSITDNKIVKKAYLDLFPSIFVNQKISSTHSIGASYSRRIQRPDYESLNPFVYMIDEYTYQKGNPFLKPQYTNSFEMRYMYSNKYMLQAGYSSMNDMITEVILADTAKKSLYQTNENIDHQKMYRLTVSAPVQITKWWKTNNNFSGIEMDFTSADLKGQRLNASHFFVIMNSNHTFKINKDISAELSGKYTSPLVYGTLKLKSEYAVDAGFSKSLLNKKGSLKLAVTDIFNTKNQKISSVYPGVNYALRQKQETRVFRLSFTYRFGNSNVKASRNKTSGLEDEQSRIKSSEVR